MLKLVTQRAGFSDVSGCFTFGLIKVYRFVVMNRKGGTWIGTWNAKEYNKLDQAQKTTPVKLGKYDGKTYWAFKDRFYWTADNLSYEDVTALLLEGEIKKRQKIERAKSVLNGSLQNKSKVSQLNKENRQFYVESHLQETEKLNQNLANAISELKNILKNGLNIEHVISFESLKTQNEQEVDGFEKAHKNGDTDAVSKYCSMVLEHSEYPEGFPQKFRVAYVPEPKELVVEYELPTKDIVPTVAEYRYIKTRDATDEKLRKPQEIKELYQDIVAALCLRSLHELLVADQGNHIDVIVFNGFVQTVDPTTGKDIRPYLISVRTTKEKFIDINLAKVDKQACLRNLGAQVSPQPDELLAVKPVIEFDMVDKRFVTETDIISGLDTRSNLMDLNPFEFENLVNNLFSKMGFEAKLTRSSRDGGIDVVAFDPRPILGGKVVIQAKRYKNVVGVSAVRDLYGSMINEGAGKGILVTTSHYGIDAYDFAKDKPIELIDGGGLLYLLEQNGYKAKIIFPQD